MTDEVQQLRHQLDCAVRALQESQDIALKKSILLDRVLAELAEGDQIGWRLRTDIRHCQRPHGM